MKIQKHNVKVDSLYVTYSGGAFTIDNSYGFFVLDFGYEGIYSTPKEATEKLISLHDFESPLDEQTKKIIKEYFPPKDFIIGFVAYPTQEYEYLLRELLDCLSEFENEYEVNHILDIYHRFEEVLEDLIEESLIKESLTEEIDAHLREQLFDCVLEIENKLSDHAPPGFYFGSHEMDGAHGFWLSEDTRIICAETNELLADSSFDDPETIIYWETCLLGEFPKELF